MQVGDTVSAGGYQFRLDNLARLRGPNYEAMRADVQVSSGGELVTTLHPEKRAFTAAQNVTSETAIDRSIWRDVYVSLGEQVEGGAWTVRVYHKPLINWIWGGALLMAIGGAFAVTDRRYALHARKESADAKATRADVAKVPATASGVAE